MAFPKHTKDIIYRLLQEPTLERLREFLQEHTGEHNSIDFKGDWIAGDKLAKIMLAIANSGGGIIVFGVSENEDKTTDCKGLAELKDKAVISNEIKNFIDSDLKYEVYDFTYNASEYEALAGRNFQMMIIEDTPEFIPFMSKKDSSHVKKNEIYVRRGTSSEVANREEIRELLSRRLYYMHPVKGEPLELDEHMAQLRTLYNSIKKENFYYKNGFTTALETIRETIFKGGKVKEPNPLYPEEEYDEFVARMIEQKKKKIERVLDLY